MPVYLRQFYYKQLIESKKKESEQVKKANKKQKSVSRPNIRKPKFKR